VDFGIARVFSERVKPRSEICTVETVVSTVLPRKSGHWVPHISPIEVKKYFVSRKNGRKTKATRESFLKKGSKMKKREQ